MNENWLNKIDYDFHVLEPLFPIHAIHKFLCVEQYNLCFHSLGERKKNIFTMP